MKNKKLLSTITISIAISSLAGCSSPSMTKSNNTAYEQGKKAISQSIKGMNQQSSFSVNDGRYINQSAHIIMPSWTKKQVEMSAYQQPLVQVMNRMTKNSGINFIYNDAIAQKLININFKGSLLDAFKQIVAKNDMHFSIDNADQNTVSWSDMETKTFNIAYLPGSTSFMLGNDNSNNNNNNNNDNTAEGGITENGAQNSLTGKVDVWADMTKTIKTLLSKDGQYNINQSDSSITVTDKPLNMRKISNFLKKYNKNLSKRVSIKVKIIEIHLDKSHQYGIDWSLVYKGIGYGGLIGNTNPNVPGYQLGQNNDSDTPNIISGAFKGSSGLINVFSTQGKTTVVNEPTVTTLNNTPSTISVTNNTAYIKSTSLQQQNQGMGLDTTNYAVTPGNISTGLKLTLIPHIKGDKVYMTIDGALSNLVNLKTKSYGSGKKGTDLHLQLPEISSKTFNQQVMVENNHLIVMSGLKTKENSEDSSKNFYIDALGNKKQLSNQKEMIILIQPTIIR